MFDGLDGGVQAIYVAPADLLVWADRVRPYIEKMAAGSGGRYEDSDLFAALARGAMLLWIALHGSDICCVMIGEVVVYPRIKALRLTGLVGNRPLLWRRLLDAVEDQARRQGCVLMESVHQPSHGILLKGYKATHWLSEKPL